MDGYDKLSKKAKDRLKQRGFYFNGATKNIEDMDNIKFFIKEFPFYAYIIHKPDDDSDKLHIHFLLCLRGTDTIKNVAEKLHCDYGDVQKCVNHRIYSRYMLHLGFDDKQDKYTPDDVVTNDIDRFMSYLEDIRFPVSTIYEDFCSLRNGRVSRSEFINKYKGEFAQLNFYQKIRVFKDIDSVAKF